MEALLKSGVRENMTGYHWQKFVLPAAIHGVLALGLGFFPTSAFAQNAVSTGTKAGFRMYYPNSNDWWLDPSSGRFDIRVNGNSPLATFNSLGNLGIGTTAPLARLHVTAGGTYAPSAEIASFVAGNSWSNSQGVVSIINPSTIQNATDRQLYVMTNASAGKLAEFVSGGSASVMMIGSNGKVGIGTTSPSVKLDVVGTVQSLTEFKSAAGNDLRLNSDGVNRDIFFQVNGVTLMNLQGSTARLGVGLATGTPAAKLTVGQSSNLSTEGLALKSSAGNYWYLYHNGASEDFALQRNNAAPSLTVLAVSGNVGIGTTSPAATADVNGAIRTNSEFQIDNNGGNITNTQGTERILWTNRGPGGDILVKTASAERMRVANGGNVGIGATAPAGKLDVFDSNNAAGQVLFRAAAQSTSWPSVIVKAIGSGAGNVAASANSVLSVGDYAGNASASIVTTGNVGVGTTSPAQKLDVAGTVNAQGFLLNGQPLGSAPDYDSGWIASWGVNSNRTFTHNLGARPRNILVYIAQNFDGSGWFSGPTRIYYANQASYTIMGVGVVQNDINFAVVRISEQMDYVCSPSTCLIASSGYVRVIAWK